MKKEILFLAMLLPMLVLANPSKNITSKLAVQPKSRASAELLINPEAKDDASKGIAIYVGDNGMIQVYNKAISSSGQLYHHGNKPTDGVSNSIYLTFEGSGSVTQFGEYSFGIPFTNPSQSASVEGSGTSPDPFQVTTTFEASDGGSINTKIKITDRYTIPHQYFDREIALTNLPQGYQARVFWALNTALTSSVNYEGYCYQEGGSTIIPDSIGVHSIFGTTGKSISLDVGTPKWTQYASNASGSSSDPLSQIINNNQLDNSICSGFDDVVLGAQWDVIPDETPKYNIKIRMSFKTQAVMATYSPDVVEVGDTSTLTLLVDNNSQVDPLSGEGFEYNLPNSVELGNITGDDCSVSPTVTGNTITASNIALAAGESCTITYEVKGMAEDSAQSGTFSKSSLDPLVGTIQVKAASSASGSAVTIPSSSWLGLLLLALASIGFGRYYFKK